MSYSLEILFPQHGRQSLKSLFLMVFYHVREGFEITKPTILGSYKMTSVGFEVAAPAGILWCRGIKVVIHFSEMKRRWIHIFVCAGLVPFCSVSRAENWDLSPGVSVHHSKNYSRPVALEQENGSSSQIKVALTPVRDQALKAVCVKGARPVCDAVDFYLNNVKIGKTMERDEIVALFNREKVQRYCVIGPDDDTEFPNSYVEEVRRRNRLMPEGFWKYDLKGFSSRERVILYNLYSSATAVYVDKPAGKDLVLTDIFDSTHLNHYWFVYVDPSSLSRYEDLVNKLPRKNRRTSKVQKEFDVALATLFNLSGSSAQVKPLNVSETAFLILTELIKSQKTAANRSGL